MHLMADGIRMWALESYIRISKVYRGKAGGKVIYLSYGSLRDKGMKLTNGHKYLVLLRPNPDSMKAIREGDYLPFWKSLRDEEIIAIVELT